MSSSSISLSGVTAPFVHGGRDDLRSDHHWRDGYVETSFMEDYAHTHALLTMLMLVVVHVVLLVPVLVTFKGVVLVQRHGRYSCFFVTLLPRCHLELLVLQLYLLHRHVLLLLFILLVRNHVLPLLQVITHEFLILVLLSI